MYRVDDAMIIVLGSSSSPCRLKLKTICIELVFANNASLRSKSKHWLEVNEDNV